MNLRTTAKGEANSDALLGRYSGAFDRLAQWLPALELGDEG